MFGAFLAQVRRAQGLTQGRAGRTAACDRQGRQPLGTRRRSAGHQYAGTSGRRTGPVSCGPDALPRPGTGAANCASPTGRFLFHAAPPPCGGLAFCPRCAAPARVSPWHCGAYSPATEHLQFTGVPSAMVLYKPMAGCPRGSFFRFWPEWNFSCWNSGTALNRAVSITVTLKRAPFWMHRFTPDAGHIGTAAFLRL